MDKPISPRLYRLGIFLLAVAIVFSLILLYAGLDADRKRKADYPTLTPTELPTVAPWTPDPEEVGKG